MGSQDQLLISIINLSLFELVLAQVLRYTTSHAVWNTLQHLFSAQSIAHVVHTRYQLATLCKGFESISNYFNKAKSLVASLSAAGHTVIDYKFSIYLLARLGTEYESLVTSLTTPPIPLLLFNCIVSFLTTNLVYLIKINHYSWVLLLLPTPLYPHPLIVAVPLSSLKGVVVVTLRGEGLVPMVAIPIFLLISTHFSGL